jgi:hypothetical protein
VKGWLPPALLTAGGIIAVLAATGVTLGLNARVDPGHAAASTKRTASVCERLLVPAYFSPAYWETAIESEHPPSDMILDVSGTGAGTAPVPEFKKLVKQAKAAGITVLGYSSTVDGARPASQVEADVRDYAAWYGVTSIFLDLVSGKRQQFAYYKRLAAYIHRAHEGAQVWMNPGVYPNQSYMSLGDVLVVFEGTYAQYVTAPVPAWAKKYPSGRFAHTIYATPAAVLATAMMTALARDAEHVYVTDLVGTNPYQGLPSYWQAEDAAATAGCKKPK